jgi:hypothetical protein
MLKSNSISKYATSSHAPVNISLIKLLCTKIEFIGGGNSCSVRLRNRQNISFHLHFYRKILPNTPISNFIISFYLLGQIKRNDC